MFWPDLTWQDWFSIFSTVATVTGILIVIVTIRYKYIDQLVRAENPTDREEFAATLRDRANAISEGDTYRRGLGAGLDWLDRTIAPPFSGRSFHWSVSLAVVYPIAAALLVWTFTGRNSSGIAGLLPDDALWWQRWFTLAALLASAFFVFLAGRLTGFRRVASLVIGTVLIIILLAGAGVGAFAVAFSVAFLISIAFNLFIKWLERRSDNRSRALLLLSWLGLAVACLVIPFMFAGWPSWIPGFNGAFIIFLALLPLTNAVFDWLSSGATRWLLRFGLGFSRRWLGLPLFILDLVLALVLLCGLTAALWLVLAIVNLAALAGGGTEQFDLNSLVQRLAADPWQPDLLWVHLMIYSTLLPTVLHAAWALVSLRAFPYGPADLERYADVLERADAQESKRIAVINYLAFWQYAPIIIVTIVCAFVFYLFYRYLGIVPTMAQFAVDWGLAGRI